MVFLKNSKKKKKQLDFIKYKRIYNRKYFVLKNRDFFDVDSSNNLIRSVYFLQKKYKALKNQAIYYKELANSFEKILKVNREVFLKKALIEKANMESYALFLRKMQSLATETHKKAARFFMESSTLLYRINEEQKITIQRRSKFIYSFPKKYFSNRKKKIRYILRNAKKSIVLLKKLQKYRSFYRKDLLSLTTLTLKSKKRAKKIKKNITKI